MSAMRARLRVATHERHLALERDLALERRLGERREVLLVLARFWGFFAGLEPSLDRVLDVGLMAGRHRLGELARDLEVLGLSEVEIGRLAVCDEAGVLPDAGFALGALYVTEGARLGGRVIARGLEAAGWMPVAGLRFWRDDTGAGELWRSFAERLEASAEDGDAVEAGAGETFDRLHRWLAQGGAFD